MSGQEHTAERRKRLENVMTTGVSTSTRVKATRVRQAERIIRNSSDTGVANPSSSSGSGQSKRVRFADQERADPKPERDTEMRAGQLQRLIPKDALHRNAKPRVISMTLVTLRWRTPC